MIDNDVDLSKNLPPSLPTKPLKFRWIIFMLSSLALFSVSLVNSSLGLTIVAMIQNEPGNYSHAIEDSENVSTISVQTIHVKWTEIEKDRMLQAISWGALTTSVIGGRLGEIMGPQRVITLCLLSIGWLNMIFPHMALLNFNAAYTIRVMQGIAFGIVSPTLFVTISRWSTVYEETFANAVVTGGYLLANAIIQPIAGLLVSGTFCQGWPSVFYLSGAINVLMIFPWYLLATDTPETHPLIKKEELNEILDNRSYKSGASTKVPWLYVLTSPPVLAYLTIPFTYGWFLSAVITQMPSFYEDVLGFSLKTNGLMNALPWIVSLAIALIGSFYADRIRQKRCMSLVLLRKTIAFIGLGTASIGIFVVTLVGDNKVAVVALVTVAKGMATLNVAGSGTSHLDISPTFAGTLSGVYASVFNLAALLMNETTAQLIGVHPTRQNWYRLFHITALLNLIGLVVFYLFGSADVQKWDPSYNNNRLSVFWNEVPNRSQLAFQNQFPRQTGNSEDSV